MNQSEPLTDDAKKLGWYCLRSQPKHEHIAAAHLRNMVGDVDVFCPRLRIKRRCRRGAVWFIEALFPCYLFARFNPDTSMQIVKSVPGIKTVLHFGLSTIAIRDEIIENLRADFDQKDLHEVPDMLQPGDEVTITSGPFHGLKASVLRFLPAADRVQLLLELLGRTTPVEVARDDVITEKSIVQLLAVKQAGHQGVSELRTGDSVAQG